MKGEQFNKLLERKLEESRTVLAGKADEYSHGGDRLSNFKRAAELAGCTPEKALIGFVTKHIIALYDFVDALPGRCMTLEQWAEKTGDIRNYMILLDGLIEERIGGAVIESRAVVPGYARPASVNCVSCNKPLGSNSPACPACRVFNEFNPLVGA